MYIVGKDKLAIVNKNEITNLYIGVDGCTIKADFNNGKGCQLGRYTSGEACRTALQMLAEDIARNEVCYMPLDEAISARLNMAERRYHHKDGKKTKGHGGS